MVSGTRTWIFALLTNFIQLYHHDFLTVLISVLTSGNILSFSRVSAKSPTGSKRYGCYTESLIGVYIASFNCGIRCICSYSNNVHGISERASSGQYFRNFGNWRVLYTCILNQSPHYTIIVSIECLCWCFYISFTSLWLNHSCNDHHFMHPRGYIRFFVTHQEKQPMEASIP
jgi:hypothetical protein